MAEDTLGVKAQVLHPAGVQDNAIISDAEWLIAQGINSNSERFLQRCNGKELIHRFTAPILAIHGDIRAAVFVETSGALYFFESLTDDIPLELIISPPLEV